MKASLSLVEPSKTTSKRRAIIICNLGGADGPDTVRPFLFNLFSDRNILPYPAIIRYPLAALISFVRAPYTRKLYERLGGRSILFEHTEAQARAIEAGFAARGEDVKVVIAMRYWHPMAAEAITQVKAFAPDEVIVIPLYPQFSATTVLTILNQLREEAKKQNMSAQVNAVCCWPELPGFTESTAALIAPHLAAMRAKGITPRLLLSAHGLPESLILRGDPYQWQVERTATFVTDALRKTGAAGETLDWAVCYQSRATPVKWIGPSLEDELARAGRDGVGVVIAPIAFVSEHLETVIELDDTMKVYATEKGVPAYARAAAVGTSELFIEGLCALADQASGSEHVCSHAGHRVCPSEFGLCPHAAKAA